MAAATAASYCSSSSYYYSRRHQEALELEISLLRATLRRNCASHRRTLYWRRAQMALRCVERHELTELFAAWQSLLEKDVAQVVARAERRQRRKQQPNRDPNFWEFLPKTKKKKNVNAAKPASSSTTAEENDDEDRQLQQSLEERVSDLCRRSTDSIRECLARIDFYAQAAVSELVRGFFLPLLTVVTGCLARIRVLLQRLQGHVAHAIQQQVLLKYCGGGGGGDGLVADSNNNSKKKKRKNTGLLPETTRQRLAATVERLLSDAMNGESTAMAAATAMQKYCDDSFSRAELTSASLQSLGIAVRESGSSSSGQQPAALQGRALEQQQGDDGDETEASPTPNNAQVQAVANDSGNDETRSQNNDEPISAATEEEMPLDEHDLGESIAVGATTIATNATRVMQPANVDSIVQSTKSNGDQDRDDDVVDQNAVVLEQLRGRKRDDKIDNKKKKKKKRKEKSGDDSSSSNNNKSSARQKKKRKNKGGDFFDDLFG